MRSRLPGSSSACRRPHRPAALPEPTACLRSPEGRPLSGRLRIATAVPRAPPALSEKKLGLAVAAQRARHDGDAFGCAKRAAATCGPGSRAAVRACELRAWRALLQPLDRLLLHGPD